LMPFSDLRLVTLVPYRLAIAPSDSPRFTT
jgi:hypothetical protein